VNQVGTKVAPKPIDMPAVRMNLFLRVNGMVEIILIPETATAANRKVVMPPKTAEGIETRAAANFEKMPLLKIINKAL
jgi:hypothetical protein